ncbi:hypothetical protein VE03_02494 [Pseudogymnoascus sp. 23342-1-I1]|nr:hypothetical protein VE03_02494 [Pseudogymnoascus sp. 23342-1-I1]
MHVTLYLRSHFSVSFPSSLLGQPADALQNWMREFRLSGFTEDPRERIPIYRTACGQFNMSSVYRKHGLRYVPPNDESLELEPAVADPTAGFQPGMNFNFHGLLDASPEIVFKIAAYTMVKHTPISVVVRFDIYGVQPPTQGGVDKRTKLPFRLHYGGEACAINSAPRLTEVLSPLFVCRDWYEIFGTAFYFMNAFSFESFGEFGIFCERTSVGNLQRIREVDITWIGSKPERSNPSNTGPRWDKSRHELLRLGEFLNLKGLVISIDESSNGRIRRKDEPDNMKKPLKKSTKAHDNYRMTRDLRKVRGMDNIYQLRGIEHIEVYDYSRELPQTLIRDQTFVQDLRTQVCSPKSISDEAKAKRKNLKLMLPRNHGAPKYKPSNKVRKVLRFIFNSPPRYARPDVPQDIAGGDSDSGSDSDGNDSDFDGDQNHDDVSDSESDDDVDYDQLDNDHQDPHDDTDSDEEDDDAPDQGANALRASPAVPVARDSAHGRDEPNNDEDEDAEMGGLEAKDVVKLEEDDDDEDFEFIHLPKPSPIKSEDDDELTFISSRKRPEVEFIRSVESPKTIDLSNFPDMEDADTAFPSIEGGQAKEEVKSEDEAVPPFALFTPRRGQTDQSSLFVRQSPSSRRSFSSRFFGYLGSPSLERKRSFEDDEDEDIVERPSLRRRLSNMTVEEDDMEV